MLPVVSLRLHSQRLTTTFLFITLAILLCGFSVRYALKSAADRSAFNRWRSQLIQLRDGVDISAPRYGYPNPPLMAVLMEAFTYCSPISGALAWYFFKAALALVALYTVFELIESPQQPFPFWAKALTALLSLKPILDDLQHGNVNLLILFLVVMCLAAYQHRRDTLAGLILGLAVACKLTPVLLVGYFAYKRAYKALLGFTIGVILFLYPGFVPALRLGFEHNQRQLVSWYGHMVRPFLVDGIITSKHVNQSLPGLASRLLAENPSFINWQDNRYVALRYDNFLELSKAQLDVVLKACMLCFVGLTLWRCRTPDNQRRGWQSAAEFSVIVLGMLLFSERTWKHHAVTLMLPLAVLCYLIATQTPHRHVLTSILAIACFLILLPGTSGNFSDEDGTVTPTLGKFALVYGAYTAAFVLLTAGLLYALPGRKTAAV